MWLPLAMVMVLSCWHGHLMLQNSKRSQLRDRRVANYLIYKDQWRTSSREQLVRWPLLRMDHKDHGAQIYRNPAICLYQDVAPEHALFGELRCRR